MTQTGDDRAALRAPGVYHCPQAGGHQEVSGQPVAVLGGCADAARLALHLAGLGCDVVLLPEGPLGADDATRAALLAGGVRVCPDLVLGVTGQEGRYVRLTLTPGWTLQRRALFVLPPTASTDSYRRR